MRALTGLWRRRATRRLRARRVRRLLRYVEPWSVLKISLVFYLCVWAVLLFVGVTLWQVAAGAGLVANVEAFVTELAALESFRIHGDQIFRIAVAGGLLLVVALTGLTVLGSVLFNLISDVTGGVRLTVVEEESARPRPRRTKSRRVVVASAPAPQPLPSAPPDSGHVQPGAKAAGVGQSGASVVPSGAEPEGRYRRGGRRRKKSKSSRSR